VGKKGGSRPLTFITREGTKGGRGARKQMNNGVQSPCPLLIKPGPHINARKWISGGKENNSLKASLKGYDSWPGTEGWGNEEWWRKSEKKHSRKDRETGPQDKT